MRTSAPREGAPATWAARVAIVGQRGEASRGGSRPSRCRRPRGRARQGCRRRRSTRCAGAAGRFRNSSRFAATISGYASCACQARTIRHIVQRCSTKCSTCRAAPSATGPQAGARQLSASSTTMKAARSPTSSIDLHPGRRVVRPLHQPAPWHPATGRRGLHGRDTGAGDLHSCSRANPGHST